MRYFYILIFSWLFDTVIIAQLNNYETKIKTDFENFVAKHISTYQTDNREYTTNRGKDWFYSYYDCLPQYSYDLVSTNSLVTPFRGYLEFTLFKWQSNPCVSEEEAENDSSISVYEERTHKHWYGYQNDNWVVLSRENKQTGGKDDNWYECDRKKHGCWEYNE
jgi:predicted choloylglycine hydrolase